MKKNLLLLVISFFMLQGCTAIMIGGAAAKATVAVVKVPFKVGGAVVGAVRNKGDKD